jgi:hypothetical protein
MKLSEIKRQLIAIQPFVKFDFFGAGNCLAIKDGEGENEKLIPLSIALSTPSLTFILESEQITQLILRYSDTYKESAEKAKTDSALKGKLAQKAVEKMKKDVLGDDEEMVKMISTMTKLGKEYLTTRTLKGWYGDENDNFTVEYYKTKEDADKVNSEDDDSKLAIWLESFTDKEVIDITMELISVVPTDQIANVPILETVVEDNETKEIVTKTVPADKVASFPRNLRSIPMEDVQPSSPKDTRNNKSVPANGS